MVAKPSYEELEKRINELEQAESGRVPAKAALRESDRILNATGKMGKIGGWEHDLTTGKAVWTEALYDIIEIPYDQEPPGVDEHLDYYPPRDRKILEQAYNQAVQNGIPFDLELQVNTAGKKLIWCRAQGEPVFEEGKCVKMRGIFQDITERKRAEERVHHLNAILRAIRDVNQLIVREKDLRRLIQRTCEILISTRGYYNAWIALFDETGSLVDAAEAGLGKDFLPLLERLRQVGLKDWGREVLERSGPLVVEDPASECSGCPLSNRYVERSKMRRRLIYGRKNYGILTVSVPRNLAFDQEELSLFNEVADDITYALDGIEAEARQKQMEKELLESEERYRTLIEMSPAAILVIQEGNAVYSNPEAGKIFGATRPAEMIGKSVLDLVHPDYHEAVIKRREQLKKEREPLPLMEQKYIGIDGRIIDVEATATLINYNGKPSMLSVFRDITERKRAETALLESELKYKTLTENSMVGIFIHQEDKYVYVNERFAEMHGYKAGELIGKYHYDLIHPDQRELIRERAYKRIRGETVPSQYEIKRLRKNGQIVWHEIMVADPIVYQGKPAIMGHEIDITRNKLAQSERELLLRGIEQAAEIVVITDSEALIQYVNPAFEAVTGFSRSEIIGQNPRVLKSGEQDALFYESLWNTIASGSTWTGRFVNKKKDATLYTEEASISPVMDADGNITNYVAVKRDITDELIKEEQLRRSQRMEAIGTLAGGIAHDFNNILSAVIGYGELAMDDAEEDSDLKGKLREIITAGYRARELIKQILAFSRQAEREIKPISVKYIAKEALKLLRASIPSTIEIREEIRSDKTIMGDPTQVHQLIVNLCTNAAQAMHQNGGILEVSLEEREIISGSETERLNILPGQYLKLAVRDTGSGIPADIIGKIFDPFFTTKEKDEGTGLGLSVVHGIVKNLEGTISVRSEPEKGTTFEIYLPATRTERDAQEAVQAVLPTGTEHILIVDDEKAIADIAKQTLERYGYRVTTRTSSIEALELFKVRSREFDLMVTDHTMPNMTGLKLTKEIKSIRPDIPVILCSGYAAQVTETGLKELGIASIVRKPVLRNDLVRTVRSVLNGKNS